MTATITTSPTPAPTADHAAVALAPVRHLRPACTIRTNRFGAYAPIAHSRGTSAGPVGPSARAFSTPAEAVTYAHAHLGALLVTIDDATPPDTAA